MRAGDAVVFSPAGALAHGSGHGAGLVRINVPFLDPLKDAVDDPPSGGGIDRRIRPAVELLGRESGR
jgi:hypothetical protein